jgi:hypothetical protein
MKPKSLPVILLAAGLTLLAGRARAQSSTPPDGWAAKNQQDIKNQNKIP